MFFSWYLKNKHFKKRNNFSGQIIPFLLAVMVTLLIAALAVIQIGKVSIEKTYTDNATDAGSLAAASNLAVAFNNLTYDNYELLKNFEHYRNIVENKLFPEANYYLTQGSLCSKAAVTSTVLGSLAIAAGIPLPPCLDAASDIIAAALFANAENFAVQSVDLISAYLIMVDLMSSVMVTCQEDQVQKYASINSNLTNAYLVAKKEGFKYAFSNSGIESKLSDAQADLFSNWLTSTMVEQIEAGATTISYSWLDKNSKNHSVSVTLTLPKVNNYILWHTRESFAKAQALYAKSASDGLAVLSKIQTQTSGIVIARVTSTLVAMLAVVCCIIFCIPVYGLVPSASIKAATTAMRIANFVAVGIVISALTSLFGLPWAPGGGAGVGEASLGSMLNNAIADEAWSKTDSGGSRKTSPSVSFGDVGDLVIIAIEDVKLESDKWEVKACVTQTHPRISVSGTSEDSAVSSCSTSQIFGGHIKVTPPPEGATKSLYEQSQERVKAVNDFSNLGSYVAVIDFNNYFTKWIGPTITQEEINQEAPEVTESKISQTINANYAAEIAEVN